MSGIFSNERVEGDGLNQPDLSQQIPQEQAADHPVLNALTGETICPENPIQAPKVVADDGTMIKQEYPILPTIQELINIFIEVTGSDEEVASQYLGYAEKDLKKELTCQRESSDRMSCCAS